MKTIVVSFICLIAGLWVGRAWTNAAVLALLKESNRTGTPRKAENPAPSDETIISAMDSWTLACAVGSENGSIGVRYGLDLWLDMSRKNWLPKLRPKLPAATDAQIESALRRFVEKNTIKDFRVVLKEQDEKRGKSYSEPLMIGAGETVEVSVGFDAEQLKRTGSAEGTLLEVKRK